MRTEDIKYYLTPLAGVVLPAAQAVVSGLVAGVVVWSVAVFIRVDAWPVSVLAAGLAGGAAWLFGLAWWRRQVETFSRQQTTLLGRTKGGPAIYQAEVKTYQLAITWNDGNAGAWLDDFGVAWEDLRDWFIGVYMGKSLGENHWTGLQGRFSKGAYHIMIDNLILRGIVRQKGRARTTGFELTGKGRAVARAMAQRYSELATYPTIQKYFPGYQ